MGALNIATLVVLVAYTFVTEMTCRRYRKTAEEALATTESSLKTADIANATAAKAVESTRVALAALKLANLANEAGKETD